MEKTNSKNKELKKVKKTIVNVKRGEEFDLGNYRFVVLEEGVYTLAILKNPIATIKFGGNNNYKESEIKPFLNDFEIDLRFYMNGTGMKPINQSLMSDNGSNEYGIDTSNVSLLTNTDVLKYNDIISKYMPNTKWWLLTPHGTKNFGYDKEVYFVNENGIINFQSCKKEAGIRPIIRLKYDVIVDSFEK